jgi:F420-dependent methylenetetrahydromethanopterin dehydrogenase
LGRKEEDLKPGTRIFQSRCEVCDKSFGYLLVEPDDLVLASNVAVMDGFEHPSKNDNIKCLCCGSMYGIAKDLFSKLIYKKE